jgi:uncharacterized protein (DUF362 family)
MSLVSFVPIDQNSNSSAIIKALELIDYRFRVDVKNIVIKPNMFYYRHCSTGQTTDPAFIGTLIDVLRQKTNPGASISIVESDASAMKCKYVFKFLGYDKLAKKYEINLINLSEEKYDVVKVKAGNYSFPLMMPQIIQNADLKINVPKLKYSIGKLGITCGMKNLYGCNPYPKKYKLHPKVAEAIVAINKAMHFDLCLLDGNIAFGVQTGRLGLVMASQDPVAFDAAAARIAGLNPNKLGYLKLARREGLGTTAFVERGSPIDYFRGRYPNGNMTMKLKAKAKNLLDGTGLSAKLGLK